MPFLNGLTLLLCFQLAGEFVVRALQLPVPGPVAGMLFLFLVLLVRGRCWEFLDQSATALLTHLSLLFVPAGVGLMVHLDLLAGEWLPVTVAIGVSTVLTLAVAGMLLQWLGRRHGSEGGSHD